MQPSLTRFSLVLALSLPAFSATAGLMEGEVEGAAFSIPVTCSSPNARSFNASTPDMGMIRTGKSEVIPAARVSLMYGWLNVELFVGDQYYKFAVRDQSLEGRSFSYAANITSKKRGSYDVSFTLDCDASGD